MRKLLSICLLAAAAVVSCFSSGCLAPPAYSSIERAQQIGRNWDYEGRQGVDDLDHWLLLRPASKLTIWHVQ
jgi:hypothetical protein